MRRTKLAWVATAATALALGLAACGDDEEGGGGAAEGGGGEAPNTAINLKVGDLVPLTGDLSVFGPAGVQAADAAVASITEAVQQAGLDSQISIEHADAETQSQAAVQAARSLVGNGASCLTGAWASSNTIPVGESVAARQRIPLISPASTSAEISTLDDNGFVYRTAPSDILQAQALADVVEEELGGTDFTVSLAARNDAYGQGFITKFKEAWEAKGGQTTGPVLYDPEQPSYNSEAGQIVQGNPDAYVIIDFPDTYAKMGAALARTGSFDATTMFTADGLAADEVPEGIPDEALEGARGTRPGTPEEGAAVDAFNEAFDAAGDEDRGTFDAQNFDAVMLCFLAALKAGSTEGPEIAEQLQPVSGPPGVKFNITNLADGLKAIAEGQDVDFEGVTGPIDFDDNGDPSAATYEVYRYSDDGSLEVIRQFQAQSAE